MIAIERTFDETLIRQILCDERIYGRMADDFSPAREDYVPPSTDAAIYLAVRVDGEVKGIWVLVPTNFVCWSVHTVMLPEIWGPIAKEAAPLAIQWVWDNTQCRRLVTDCPVYGQAAIKFAKAAGMTQFGINEASIMKFGKLHAQVMLGISKPEVSPSQS